ncbi:protein phosphatase regulator [Coemansia sp. Benny D115]|nr:protein phosphatase regulator [Coemansia sp. Benny D115]
MSDADEQKRLIQSWLEVNPSTEDQARFYLEANNWDLTAALGSFYEQPPLSEGLPSTSHEDGTLPPDPVLGTPPAYNAAPVMSAGPTASAASVPRRRYGTGARIATLSSLGGRDEDDEEGGGSPQEWYAGGERSGMAVRPPPKDDDEGGSLVSRILKRAAESSGGPESAGDDGLEGAQKPSYFSGRGHALGDSSSSTTGGGSGGQAAAGGSGSDDEGEDGDDGVAQRHVTFWRNGFSVGDGPLHHAEDPVTKQHLEAILQGRAPEELLGVRPGQRVELRVTQRTSEDYEPPARAPAPAFSGQGHRLGGVAPEAVATAADVAAASVAGREITLDPAQRTVQVQVRLGDGSRLVARVNPSHTVGDLRAYVLQQRPEAGGRPFVFRTIMPPKVLDDDAATIEEAGIANAAVAQCFV